LDCSASSCPAPSSATSESPSSPCCAIPARPPRWCRSTAAGQPPRSSMSNRSSPPPRPRDPILERLTRLHPRIIDLSLERVARLLEALGAPQRHLPPVIHVAGTNGKGSVVAYLQAMLEAARTRVHVYTSPHLVRFNERIRVAGRLIDEADLEALLAECERVNGSAPITFFEVTTAAAFLAFTRTPSDVELL